MSKAITRVAATAALLSVVLLGGCKAPLTLPESFVELEDGGQGFRAVTSDDARLWVRTIAEPTEADVGFWVDNLRRDFVEQRGFELIGSGDVEDVSGNKGAWLELRAVVAGEEVGYLVAVWVEPGLFWFQDDEVKLVEFCARREVFDSRVDDVRAALRTVQ